MSAGAVEQDEDFEIVLWQSHREGSPEAREKLFELHLPFARRIAWRHYHQRSRGDLEHAELVQLACTGLLEAIDAFDATRGVPFRGYAARRINGSVLDGIARMSEVREQLSCRRRIERERLASLLPAEQRDASGSEAVRALADLAASLAIGIMLEGTHLARGEEVADPAPGPYDGLVFKRLVQRLREEMSGLPERERSILQYHYEEGLLFEQIGNLLGISKGRVSHLHRSALEALRKRMKRAGHFRVEG